MRRRGFTLIEISTIVVILAMIAAITYPSLASVVKSQRIRSYLQDVERLTTDARGIAVQTGQTVSLASDGEGSFQIRASSEDDSGEGQVFEQIAPVQGISATSFRLGADDIGADEWEIRFYEDGTADPGGVLLTEASSTWALVIEPKTGRGRVQRGELPDTTLTEWEAGDYVRRS
ncbi:MAG: prepilin-type N-terminal cleavage/methylation domain-containing protein [Methanoregulaceae archaeon]|nr:prepilin-type N-terminal cleavage/methylation domain-containing protein [Methanoregulaceae archaeon]